MANRNHIIFTKNFHLCTALSAWHSLDFEITRALNSKRTLKAFGIYLGV